MEINQGQIQEIREYVSSLLDGKHIPSAKTVVKWAKECQTMDDLFSKADGHMTYWEIHDGDIKAKLKQEATKGLED